MVVGDTDRPSAGSRAHRGADGGRARADVAAPRGDLGQARRQSSRSLRSSSSLPVPVPAPLSCRAGTMRPPPRRRWRPRSARRRRCWWTLRRVSATPNCWGGDRRSPARQRHRRHVHRRGVGADEAAALRSRRAAQSADLADGRGRGSAVIAAGRQYSSAFCRRRCCVAGSLCVTARPTRLAIGCR